MRIQQVSASFLDKRRGRRRSPEAELQISQFKQAIRGLASPDDAYLVGLDEPDKPATIRQRLLRAAREEGREIVVRRHPDGFVIGLMTDSRRRKPRNPWGSTRTQESGKVSIRILDDQAQRS